MSTKKIRLSPSGPFVTLTAADVDYDDLLVPPPLGATDVQQALDALKGGPPLGAKFAHGFYIGDGAPGGQNIVTAFAPSVVQLVRPIAFSGETFYSTIDMGGNSLFTFVLLNLLLPGRIALLAGGFNVKLNANTLADTYFWTATA